MNIVKLPDGRWRCRVSVTVNGEHCRKQFTGARRGDVLKEAQDWATKKQRMVSELSVSEAVERYISSRESVISPSTLRTYESIYTWHLRDLDMPLAYFDNRQAQLFISEIASRLSPKTVENVWQLLAGSIRFMQPDHVLNVRLPREKKPQIYCPDDTDIKKLLEVVKDTPLQAPVELAAFIPARRSEICALRGEDVNGRTVSIRRAMVRNSFGEWIIKDQPKTAAGYREVTIPESTALLLPASGPIIDVNPDRLTHLFKQTLQKTGLPAFRFHDLRHYGASIMLAMGIPVKEVQRRGGWDSVDVLQRIYAHALRDQIREADERSAAHFESLKK